VGSLPNILLVTIDQWRADCLGAFGNSLIQTPNLDKLAAEGTLFKAHHTQASPCAPSRACLLTGTYQHTNRVVFNGTPLDADLTNLALEARAGGYDPQLFGHTDTTIDPRTVNDADDPRLSTYEGPLPGFTVALELPEERESWYQWLQEKGYDISDREKFLKPEGKTPIPEGKGQTWPASIFSADETETAFVVEKVIEKIKTLPEPWFLHVSLYRPHPPFHVPAPFNDMYDPEEVPEPLPAGDISHPFLNTLTGLRALDIPDNPIEVRQTRATYYGMVTEVDNQMGRLLEAISPVEDHTVVAVTSDHGEMLGDHTLFSKMGFHDQAFHIPLIIRSPQINGPKGQVIEEFTENVDIMPTLLDLANLPIPEQCQGRSLTPFLKEGKAPKWRDKTHWEFDYRVFANMIDLPLDECHLVVERTETTKLVKFGEYPAIYFDLENDPNEQNPLTDHPLMEEAIQSLNSWMPPFRKSELVNRLATPDGMITLSDPPSRDS
tara:strand:+ start:9837 stop:11315 length:1479 start_codon:yes stop_codon:yes gene_type:complete